MAERDKAYITVIKALRRLFDEQYPDGGWLPPGREMADQLNVSDPTYWKALQRMVAEGWASSFPQRGHFVTPAKLRCRKVGVIHNVGGPSPFLPETCLHLQHFLDHGFHPQIIQASSLDKLHENALLCGVEGLLWLAPPAKAARTANKIHAAGDMPLVLVAPRGDLPELDAAVELVFHDSAQDNRTRAEFMAARGHRSVAYVASKANGDGQIAALRTAGVADGPDAPIPDVVSNPERLSRLLRRHQVTGVITEGGDVQVNCLCAALAALPEATRPEVLVPGISGLPHLRVAFPGVKLLEHQPSPKGSLELAAAKLLLNHLETPHRRQP